MRRVTINDPTTNRTAPQQPRQRCPEGLESYKAVPAPTNPKDSLYEEPVNVLSKVYELSKILASPEALQIGQSPLDFLSKELSKFTSASKIFDTEDLLPRTEVAKDFHSACDNVPNVLVIIKSGQYIAGGYTEVPFESRHFDFSTMSHLKPNPSLTTFLFSLNRQKVYPLKDASKALDCTTYLGPSFGDEGLVLGDDYAAQNTNFELLDGLQSGFHTPDLDSQELFVADNFVVDAYEVFRLE